MSLCSLRLSRRHQVRLVVHVPAPAMVRKITLMCSRPAATLLLVLHIIFSSVSGNPTRLCPPSWEAPEPRPLFRQCLW